MRLCGDDGGEDAVADKVASHGAVIYHRDRGPVCRQLKCRIRGQGLLGVCDDRRVAQRQCARDECARRDELVAERDCADALRVGHFRRDGDGLRGERRIGRMVDVANGGAVRGGEDGVLRTGCAEGFGHVAERGIHGEIEDVINWEVFLVRARLRRFGDAVDGDGVGAGVEQRVGVCDDEFAPRVVAAFIDGGGVKCSIAHGCGREAEAGDLGAVDPNNRGVVVLHAEQQMFRNRARHGEGFAEIYGAVRPRHVRELRIQRDTRLCVDCCKSAAVLLEHADGRCAGEPCAVLREGFRVPRAHRRGGFAGAFAVAPAAAASGEVIHHRRRGGAGAPVAADVVVEPGVDEFERGAFAIWQGWPRRSDAEIYAIHFISERVAEDDFFAHAVEAAGPRTERGDVVNRGHRRRISRDDEVSAGCDGRAIWENELHAVVEAPAAHIHGRSGGVVEFDELGEQRVAGGVVVDFVNLHMQVRREHGEGDDFCKREPGIIGDEHADGNRLPEVAGEVVRRDELVADEGEESVVRVPCPGDEREGERVAGVGIHRLERRDEAAADRRRADVGVVRNNVRRRSRRREHGDVHGRDGGV